MGLRLIWDGIGKGSMFRHGRFLGVHNPLGSSLGKARDPFINTATLIRLSHSLDSTVRQSACISLSGRIARNEVSAKRLIMLIGHPETMIKVAVLQRLAESYQKQLIAVFGYFIGERIPSSIQDFPPVTFADVAELVNTLKMKEIPDAFVSNFIAIMRTCKIEAGPSEPTAEEFEAVHRAWSGGGDTLSSYHESNEIASIKRNLEASNARAASNNKNIDNTLSEILRARGQS